MSTIALMEVCETYHSTCANLNSSATVLKFNIQLKHIRSEDITMLTQFLQTSWTKWKNPFLYILDYN